MSVGLPEPGHIPRSFWSDLARAQDRVLWLDYDGTLAPFRRRRDQARPYVGVSSALDAMLAGQHTRVVLVTGRAIWDIVRLLKLRSGIEIWGSHGLERRLRDGTYREAAIPQVIRNALSSAKSWALDHVSPDQIEEKPGCLALHWRGLPVEDVIALRQAVQAAWTDYTAEGKLLLRGFDGGLELRAAQGTKADAVVTVLREQSGQPVAAYLGDDITDEDAFEAIEGFGLGVLVRKEYRTTAAQAWLRPPDDLLSFLRRWHRVASGEQSGGE